MNVTKKRIERGGGAPGSETALALLRRPFVQLVLVATVVAQVVSVHTVGVGAENDVALQIPRVPEPLAAVMKPAVAVPDSAVRAAWLEKAVAREAARLGSKYRLEGYDVTPKLALQIGEAAAEFDIDPNVAFGLVRAESSFRNRATSSVGAIGLTQLMPRTAEWVEPGVTRSELRDPETNLRVGFKYLRHLLDKYDGDQKLALLAYNRGPGTVDRALRRGRNPDNGYADFVYGKANHGHQLFTR